MFLWIFRASRNWAGVSSLLPAMRNHLSHALALNGSRPGTRLTELDLTTDSGDPINDYSIIFRELFCLAAADLAYQFNEPFEKAGILYDEILSTGQKIRNKKLSKSTPNGSLDLERGFDLPVLGRGQLLFLVRSVNRREAEHLQAAGFRFANPVNVVDLIASSMQINTNDLSQRLSSMKRYASENHILEPGVHVACFTIRASVYSGFDILVRKDARNQLPTMQMPLELLEGPNLELLQSMASWKLHACLSHLVARKVDSRLSPKARAFATQLHYTIEALRDEIDDPFINEAVLQAEPVLAPCRGLDDVAKPGMAQLIAFTLIAPIHNRAPGAKLEFTPLAFFKMQQHVYPYSPDHAFFTRKVHREFGPILNQARSNVKNRSSITTISTLKRLGSSSQSCSGLDKVKEEHNLPTLIPKARLKEPSRSVRFWNHINDNTARQSHSHRSSPEKTVYRNPAEASSESNLVETQNFGGIMVSQEVSIDVKNVGKGTTTNPQEIREHGMEMSQLEEGSGSSAKELTRMGTHGIAIKEDEEPMKFVDKLFAACVEMRK